MTTYTLNSLVDQAVDELPLFRRVAYKSLLSNQRTRHAFSVMLLDRMDDEPACEAIVMASKSDDFSGEATLAINPETLKVILDLIKAILPIILQIFLKI